MHSFFIICDLIYYWPNNTKVYIILRLIVIFFGSKIKLIETKVNYCITKL